MQNKLNSLFAPVSGIRKRASSYDRSGGNADVFHCPPQENRILMEHQGSSGFIMRIWFTISTNNPDYLKKITLRFIFDNQVTVDNIPLGMFTGTGPWLVNDLTSAAANIMRARMGNMDQDGTGRGSFNLNWQMPFCDSAQIEIFNGLDEPFGIVYYIDYGLDNFDFEPLYFHACYNINSLTKPAVRPEMCLEPGIPVDIDLPKGGQKNLSVEANYRFADIANQQGKYVGTVLAVESHPDRQGKWYEGDDMFLIDGEAWPPSVHGTGTEDYFGMAWGFHRPYQAFDHGITHYERNITDHDRYYDGRFVVYRWHIDDPIFFHRSLSASMEAGHANECKQHYESVAIWYGREQ